MQDLGDGIFMLEPGELEASLRRDRDGRRYVLVEKGDKGWRQKCEAAEKQGYDVKVVDEYEDQEVVPGTVGSLTQDCPGQGDVLLEEQEYKEETSLLKTMHEKLDGLLAPVQRKWQAFKDFDFDKEIDEQLGR